MALAKPAHDAARLPPPPCGAATQLVDLVAPGPSGTVASTAAAATAARAALVTAAPELGPGGLAVTLAAGRLGHGSALQARAVGSLQALCSRHGP